MLTFMVVLIPLQIIFTISLISGVIKDNRPYLGKYNGGYRF